MSHPGGSTLPKAPRKRSPELVYQLHVSLEELRPLIWRRLWVPDTLTLVKLDRVIQTAMGWTNSHMHEFEIDGARYTMLPDEYDDIDPPGLPERGWKIGDLLLDHVERFTHLYDFGDGWKHEVVIEARLEPDEEHNTWPLCLAGANACPPEDVGGAGGYMEFLHAMRDPRHEEHRAMWRWAGGPFDPRGFDVNAVNRALARLR